MRFQCAVLLCGVLLGGTETSADDWPQFLGPNRNGISSEQKLVSEFPEEGPEILWQVPLGTGMSGIAVKGKRAYTLYQNETGQIAVALNASSGKKLWETLVAPVYENSMGHGPRATPTIHDGSVFTFSGEGVLTALDSKDGTIIWSVDTVKKLGGRPSDYGMASSPLIAANSVIVQVGARNGTVAAFDIKTGERKWTAGHEAAGYSSPVLATLAGKSQVVAFAGDAVMGIDPADGKPLWSYAYTTDYKCNTATPVILDDSSLLISAGESHGSTVLTVSAEGSDFQVKEVWSSLGKDSVLRAEWQTPVLLDGYLYGLDNAGSAGPITNLVCVRAADGEQLWIEKRFGKSNHVWADGRLYLSTMRGELVIVTVSPEGAEETARAVVTGQTRQAPVIANGRLYLRDDKEVVCVNVKAK